MGEPKFQIQKSSSEPKIDPRSPNIIGKSAEELISQLEFGNMYGFQEYIDEVIEECGYDYTKVKKKLESLKKDNPAKYKEFLKELRAEISIHNADIRAVFSEALDEITPDEDFEQKKVELFKKCIFVESGEVDPELKDIIKDFFPTGNYLVHGSEVDTAIKIVRSGGMKSVANLYSESDDEFDDITEWGGHWGICWTLNNVKVIPGTVRHMVSFIAPPEKILDEQTQLVAPFAGGEDEVQLVDQNYDVEEVAQATVTDAIRGQFPSLVENFFKAHIRLGLSRNLLLGGDAQRPSDLTYVLEAIRGEEGAIKKTQELYKFDKGIITIMPEFQDVRDHSTCAVLIYIDYLLNHTSVGKRLGKTISTVTPDEVIKLDYSRTRDSFDSALNAAKGNSDLGYSTDISVPIDDTIMMIPDKDLKNWINVIADSDTMPKAIIVYNHMTGPKLPNWTGLKGHHQRMNNDISETFSRCEVPLPSLSTDDIFGEGGQSLKQERYVSWESSKDAKKIQKDSDGNLVIVD